MDPKCLMHLVGLVVYISVIHGVFAIYHDIPDQVLVYLQAQMLHFNLLVLLCFTSQLTLLVIYPNIDMFDVCPIISL